MTTSHNSSSLAINEQAIVAAITQAAHRRCQGFPDEFVDSVIGQAIDCIADEFAHNLTHTNINQIIMRRINVLLNSAKEQDCEL